MDVRNATARRERAREQVRRDILLASAEVFARRGYEAATLADLAEAAGFAPPSLYRYFESKEEIFRSLHAMLREELSATFDAPADRRLPLAERLVELLRAQARLAESHRPLLAVLTCPSPGTLSALDGRPGTSPGAGLTFYEERLRSWLDRNASARELRAPREVVARLFAGIAFTAHVQAMLRPESAPVEIPRLVDLALHGLAVPPPPSLPNRSKGARR